MSKQLFKVMRTFHSSIGAFLIARYIPQLVPFSLQGRLPQWLTKRPC